MEDSCTTVAFAILYCIKERPLFSSWHYLFIFILKIFVPFQDMILFLFLYLHFLINSDIRNWIRNIEQHASDNVNKILVGNKADMDESKRVCTFSRFCHFNLFACTSTFSRNLWMFKSRWIGNWKWNFHLGRSYIKRSSPCGWVWH